MITKQCIEMFFPIVGESWERLQDRDVLRLLDQIYYFNEESLQSAAAVVRKQRPDLADAIRLAVAEINSARGWEG